MKLTEKEIKILSLMDEVPAENFIERFKEHIDIHENEIKQIIKKLLKEKLAEKVSIPQGDKEVYWYFRTKKGESVNLDDNLRFISDYGRKFGEGKKDGPISKFRRNLK